jgi:hypothetical protein
MTDVLGSGIAFPLGVDRRGGLGMAHAEVDVDQALRLILSTAPGERPMRPEFGCHVHDYLFDRIDAETIGRIERAIRFALDRWEPRVEIHDIEFDTSGALAGRLDVMITYRLRATNDIRNLVYPFYVIPAED